MTDRRISCPDCGAPVPAEAPGGACPACLLAGGLDDTDLSGIPTRSELEAAFPSLEIGELLGRGGMGAVFKARQKRLDRQVALKVLPVQDPATAQAFAERFEREARALARLEHRNIVRVYEFGVEGGLHYLLMEFVDGVNLRDAMEDGRMTPRQALAVIPQICDALQYAHDQGVVHRDIKPENVLFSKDGVVKVADFGLAKLVTASAGADPTLTRAGQVMGTLHYMAPEQIESPSAVDHRADIYSLGVVFYELLTGDLPLGRFEPPSERVQIDARLDEVVLRALEKKRERRYQRADDVKTAVSAISDPGDGGPREPRRRPRFGDRMRARHHRQPDARPRWWEIEKELGIDWHEYSLRAVAGALVVPFTLVFAVTAGLIANDTTNDASIGFLWASLVLGLGLFCAVTCALGALPATAASTGKKGRWLAVFTLVFSLVAVPIALWTSYWLLDVSGVRAQAEFARQPWISTQRPSTTSAVPDGWTPRELVEGRSGPDGWPLKPYPMYDDPDFALTDTGSLPIPASAGAAIKSRLEYLLGVSGSLARTARQDLSSALPFSSVTAAKQIEAQGDDLREFVEQAALGRRGLAFLGPDTLPVPLEDFTLVSAHVEQNLVAIRHQGPWACSGTATARSAEWELTFTFEAGDKEIALAVAPVAWTRLPKATRRPERVRVVLEDGTEQQGFSRPVRDLELFVETYFSRLRSGEPVSDWEAMSYLSDGDRKLVQKYSPEELVEARRRMMLGLSMHFSESDERLANARIREIEFTRNWDKAIVRVDVDGGELAFPVVDLNGGWNFELGKIVVNLAAPDEGK